MAEKSFKAKQLFVVWRVVVALAVVAWAFMNTLALANLSDNNYADPHSFYNNATATNNFCNSPSGTTGPDATEFARGHLRHFFRSLQDYVAWTTGFLWVLAAYYIWPIFGACFDIQPKIKESMFGLVVARWIAFVAFVFAVFFSGQIALMKWQNGDWVAMYNAAGCVPAIDKNANLLAEAFGGHLDDIVLGIVILTIVHLIVIPTDRVIESQIEDLKANTDSVPDRIANRTKGTALGRVNTASYQEMRSGRDAANRV